MKNTVDVYKKAQQGNLLGPQSGGGVVDYRNPFYGICPARPAFCLVTFAKRAAYSETEKRFHVNFSFEVEHMNLINIRNFLFTLIIVTLI